MNHHHSGHPHNWRSVAQRWIFFPLSLLTLASLLYTPLIGAGQPTGRNHAFAFHGHFVNVAAVGAARWLNSQEGQNSEEQHFTILPQPVPIPGGLNLPPLIHVFGPSDLDTEPNVITDFKGFSALAYPTGTNAARDNNGNFYDMSNDMRVFQGEYVAADGSHHRGTFVFI
jgi:hypothetical protein